MADELDDAAKARLDVGERVSTTVLSSEAIDERCSLSIGRPCSSRRASDREFPPPLDDDGGSGAAAAAAAAGRDSSTADRSL